MAPVRYGLQVPLEQKPEQHLALVSHGWPSWAQTHSPQLETQRAAGAPGKPLM
jgi:hypothetical protein